MAVVPRVMLLDLDGTLLDYGDEDWALTVRYTCDGLVAAAPQLEAGRLAATYERICRGYWQSASVAVMRSPAGSVDGHMVWRELWQEALSACGQPHPRLAELAVRLYRDDRLRRYRLHPEVPDALAALRQHVEGIAVVTNGPGDTQRDKLAATGLDRLVDVVITSGEQEIAKPDARIFQAALRQFRAAPQHAWHVGDSLTSDIAGAHNAGLAGAVWLDRTGAPAPPRNAAAPTHRISSLAELLDLVAQPPTATGP